MVAAPDSVPALLSVSDLCVTYHGEQTVRAVRNLSYQLRAGETLGIVGESGSGKTQGALALMGLLPDTADVSGSAILVQENTTDRDLLTLDQDALNTVRGSAMAMIFQDPMTALNPHLTIGRQMSRVLERHRGMSRADALSAAADMLDAVRVPEARARLAQYPHEMSGGMRQRIMIATALLCRPSLLIADEPTTALDVTVQAQILELMADLQRELGTAILLITHDMGVVAANCDRVLVMKDGVERETGDVGQIFAAPADQYTKDLLAAVPRLDASSSAISPTDAVESSASSENQSRVADDRPRQQARQSATDRARQPTIRSPQSTLLEVDNLSVAFDAGRATLFGPRRWLKAVDDVSFTLAPGETLGIVGESGCGKSTLARGVLQLLDNYSGRVAMLGEDLSALSTAALKARRADLQVVFQDPLASLNPRMTIGDIVAEPLRTFRP
ncbi:MAG: ABC transporter ATP-binding protein, partial [Gammaproteobacteria bacterium]|nr:ABC transporter ATP-binding protein [Gammaproteobacteria bacterium]